MSTGFSFGAKTTAPTFGGTNTLSFGAAPIPNQFGFGSNTQQQQQQPQSTGFQLGSSFNKPTGSVAPQLGGFSYGASTAAPSTGFGFGANTSTTAPTAGALAPQPGGLNFGTSTAAAAPSTGFGFGATIASTAPTGFGVGTTTASNAFNVGAALVGTTTGLNLASSTSSAAPTAFSLGGLTSYAAPTPSLNFGTTTAATPSTGLSFNLPTSTIATAAPLSLGFGTTASTGFSLAPSTTVTAAAPVKLGLGGIQTSTASGAGTTAAKEVPPKEQQLPNEIQQDIENFKNYIKQQKMYSSDVSRCCVKDFRSVESQIGELNNVLKEIESQLQRNRCLAEKLKYDTAQGLQLLEMAQRTQDTPAGLQYENVAPMNYFLGLADNFEKEMHALKIQIENTDKYVKNFGQPATLTSQDLSMGMKRLHDTFVALAGRLQSVHTQVESQKELYTNLRKQLANDFSNPFEPLDKKLNPKQTVQTQLHHSPPKIACGPTPFNQIITSNFPNTNQQNLGSPYPGISSATSGGFSLGSSALPSLLGNTSVLNKTNPGFLNTTLWSGLGSQNTTLGNSFQLQKPPTGNKRGKQ